jgi:hypothetical protein
MEQHISYEERWKYQCDFVVTYRFFTPEEGGRKSGPPGQGYKSDFMCAEDESTDRLYMIHPEFLDENNNVIVDTNLR